MNKPILPSTFIRQLLKYTVRQATDHITAGIVDQQRSLL